MLGQLKAMSWHRCVAPGTGHRPSNAVERRRTSFPSSPSAAGDGYAKAGSGGSVPRRTEATLKLQASAQKVG